MSTQEIGKEILKILASMVDEKGTFQFYISDKELYDLLPDTEPKKINLAVEYLEGKVEIDVLRTFGGYSVRLNSYGYDLATE